MIGGLLASSGLNAMLGDESMISVEKDDVSYMQFLWLYGTGHLVANGSVGPG